MSDSFHDQLIAALPAMRVTALALTRNRAAHYRAELLHLHEAPEAGGGSGRGGHHAGTRGRPSQS